MADIEKILGVVENYFEGYPHPGVRASLLLDEEKMDSAEARRLEEELKAKEGYDIIHLPVLEYSDEEVRIKGAHTHEMIVITREGDYS